jgi:hypothetical protein
MGAVMSKRLSSLLWWLTPAIFLLWLDGEALKVWFFQDDFAWLSLLRDNHSVGEIVGALFSSGAQGTIRPWSDRGFFLLFESLFGLDSLPFRVCAFVTMAANLGLVAWIVRRITGSRIAGLLAPVFWIVNAAMVTVISWNSAFNEALCAFFLLSAMALFIRWAETGKRRFWWSQLVVFSVGFGALEVNVVFPALAAAYAVFVAPPKHRKRLLISLAPLVALSVIYFVLHRAAAPLPATGPYAVHLDLRVFRTLAKFWHWSLLPQMWTIAGHSHRLGEIVFWVICLALVAFLVREIAERRYRVLYFFAWFLIPLAPMIPLPDHTSYYYLTIPLIGLSMLGAWGVACAWQSGALLWRIAVLVPVVAYLTVMIGGSRTDLKWWVNRSGQVRAMVLGVAAAKEAHPEKTIVLHGLTTNLYEDAIAHSAFYPLGLDYIYLTPGSETRLRLTGSLRENPRLLKRLVLDPAVMRRAIAHEDVVVYSVVGDHLRNITGEWERYATSRVPTDQEPRRLDVGNPLLAYLLGPEWYSLEAGVRWMPQRATVRLGGPRSAKDRLLLEGFCPESQLEAGPLHLKVSVDGIPLVGTEISSPESDFRRLFDIPPSLIGRETVEVAIGVDRAFRDGGGRELGLVFGTIAVEP